MANLTKAAAAAIKALSKVRNLNRHELLLLDHVADSAIGDYRTIATIPKGKFLLSTGAEGITLRIPESTRATAELLGQLVAVAFQEKVYKIAGTEKRQPLGEPRYWTFTCRPSGEYYD